MITEIPTSQEFHTTGLNQLYLAWQIAVRALEDVEYYDDEAKEIGQFNPTDADEAATAYWRKLQPDLNNAVGLIQQSIEMALKGKIAETSPYLLIARDPKGWPTSVDTKSVPFSEFRTIDAIDLVKVHNTFCSPPLDDKFQHFWNKIRKDRNQIMHSVTQQSFPPKKLIKDILIVVEKLFSDVRWPQRLLDLVTERHYAAHWLSHSALDPVIRQIGTALQRLEPADMKRFFDFDPKKNAYHCPRCVKNMYPDILEDDIGSPKLAQLTSRCLNEKELKCIVCDELTIVERKACRNPDCKTNVISGEVCLSCGFKQNTPRWFKSSFELEPNSFGSNYTLNFGCVSGGDCFTRKFKNGCDAVEHARLAMLEPYLSSWDSVDVSLHSGTGHPTLLGNWQRQVCGLVWTEGIVAETEDVQL